MPQSEDGLWAVGYARGYSALEDGMVAAKRDAYSRLRTDRQRILEGEKIYESAPGFRQSLESIRFTEKRLPDTLRSVTYLDSASAGGMTLVLAAWTPEASSLEGFPPEDASPRGAPLHRLLNGRRQFAPDPPAWVQDGAGDSRAVGQAPRYYYLENSWHRAETRARRRLAFQAASKIEQLEKSTEAWRHGVTAVKTSAYLRNVQTLARWAGEGTCYVLVEGTVDEMLVE